MMQRRGLRGRGAGAVFACALAVLQAAPILAQASSDQPRSDASRIDAALPDDRADAALLCFWANTIAMNRSGELDPKTMVDQSWFVFEAARLGNPEQPENMLTVIGPLLEGSIAKLNLTTVDTDANRNACSNRFPASQLGKPVSLPKDPFEANAACLFLVSYAYGSASSAAEQTGEAGVTDYSRQMGQLMERYLGWFTDDRVTASGLVTETNFVRYAASQMLQVMTKSSVADTMTACEVHAETLDD